MIIKKKEHLYCGPGDLVLGRLFGKVPDPPAVEIEKIVEELAKEFPFADIEQFPDGVKTQCRVQKDKTLLCMTCGSPMKDLMGHFRKGTIWKPYAKGSSNRFSSCHVCFTCDPHGVQRPLMVFKGA